MTLEEIRILSTDYDRISEAYLAMRNAGHLPASDLLAEQTHDQPTLKAHARNYARMFLQEQASLHFQVGHSNYETNRALAFAIEAARLLCRGDADRLAVKLLSMAIDEIKKESSAYRT